MAYDLEEQEQIDAIKGWWADYGNLVTMAAIACLVTIAAFQGWRWYKANQTEKAASLFLQLEQAERGNEHKTVRDIAAQVVDRHGSSHYAAMAALLAAKSSYSTGEMDDARKYLQWTIDKAREDELRDVARLRLAGILLDEKKYDDALKVVSAKPSASYEGLYADMRGDILAAQGKAAEARPAYQLALDKTDAASQYRGLIELKLDALGETK